jgi:signal transduction histidine kinase
LTEPLPQHSQDEIGRLTHTFNQMTNTLGTRNLEIGQKNHELSFFNEITTIINQSLNLHTILEKSLHKILQLMRANTGWVYVFDPRNGKLNLVSHLGSPSSSRCLADLELSGNPIGAAFSSGRSCILRDVHELQEITDDLAMNKVKNLLLFTLRTQKHCLGIMAIGSHSKHFFHQCDLELLSRIGEEIGVSVENSRLYAELSLKIKELEVVNHDLQESDRLKNQILSNVSHELRTPITSIRTYIDLFLSDRIGNLDELQKDKLGIIKRNITHLMLLINNLLTQARFHDNHGRLKNMEMVNIHELMDQVIADTVEISQAKGLEIIRQGIQEPVVVRIRRHEIEQVLQNLISNAIKFTAKGTITLGLSVYRGRLPGSPVEQSEQELLEISVQDTGIGIPRNSLNKIFQRFYQVDASSTRKYIGTGLGLAILKEIVEAHGSQICVESQVGAGSRFWFSLPVVNLPQRTVAVL